MESLKTTAIRLKQGRPTHILGLGDSLTYGWEVTQGFYDRFVTGLQDRYPNTPIDSINAGVPGDTAEGGLARLEGLVAHNPNLSCIQFGLNDFYASIPLNRITSALQAIGQRLIELNCLPIFLTSCSVAHLPLVDEMEIIYRGILQLAQATGSVGIALHEYWHSQVGVEESLFGWDRVHPTDRGHAIMAEGLLAHFY